MKINKLKYLSIAICYLVSALWSEARCAEAECEVRVFDCGQGNTVVARYRNECIAFDAGQTSSTRFAKFVEGQDEDSDAGAVYTFENNGSYLYKAAGCVISTKYVEEGDPDALQTLKENYDNFTQGQVKTVTISHPHRDHYSLFTHLGLDKANHVVLGGSWPNKKGDIDVKKLRHKGKIALPTENNWKFSPTNDSPQIDVLAVDVSEKLRLNKRDANVDSMVVKLTHNHHSILFTGDAEEATWKYIHDRQSDKLKTSILILSHHGAIRNGCTYPELLELVSPTVCLITAGFKYNHPSVNLINICKNYYETTNPFRTTPHFISYCVGDSIHTCFTNFPIFTTMDSGGITVNLTKLSIITSRGINPSSPVVIFGAIGTSSLGLEHKQEDGPVTEDVICATYRIKKTTLAKKIIDEDGTGTTYHFIKKGNSYWYYKLGALYFPQKFFQVESSESESEPEENSESDEE